MVQEEKNKTGRVMLVLGTRPEAIKLYELIHLFREYQSSDCMVVNTGQHTSLLDDLTDDLKFNFDVTFEINRDDSSILQFMSSCILKLETLISSWKPDIIIVQGDTSTALVAALTGFYCGVEVFHVEAGLRTESKIAPFPEEVNRRLISQIADFHFAPTEHDMKNLLDSGISRNEILITGNTVVDVLMKVKENADLLPQPDSVQLNPNRKNILVTFHRRESWGEPIREICRAINTLASEYLDYNFILPLHPNPRIKEIVDQELTKSNNVMVVKALKYTEMIYFMSQCQVILTDSGGIQEEAPTFNVPVMVLRDETERMQGVLEGVSFICGTSNSKIVEIFRHVIKMESNPQQQNPYGTGDASNKIFKTIITHLSNKL